MLPSLPFFLMYMAGLTAMFPASQQFILPFLMPTLLGLSGVWLFSRSRKKSWARWLVLFLFLSMGLAAPGLEDRFRPPDHILNLLKEGQRADVVGVVAESPKNFPGKVQFLIELESIDYGEFSQPAQGLARITLYQPSNAYHAGDRLKFHRIKLKRPRNFKNPGGFDYEHHLRTLGIHVLGGVAKSTSIQKRGEGMLHPLFSLRAGMREKMTTVFDRTLSAEASSLLKAMVLGEKQFLSEDLRQAYIDTGMAHLMAVSGLHIGFVAAASYFLLYPLVFRLLWRKFPTAALAGWARKITAGSCLLPVLFYMSLVGPKISALRAGLMVILVLIAIIINREKHLFNALLLAAFAILLWNPHALLSVSFQLSFMALLTILWAIHFVGSSADDAVDRMGEQPWYRRVFFRNTALQDSPKPVIDFLYGTAFVSLAATLGTLPILIFYFNRVSTVGLPLNLLMVPLASLLIPLTLLGAVLGMVWLPVGQGVMFLVGAIAKIFLTVPIFVATLPYTSLYLATPPELWIFLYYFLLLGIPWVLKNKNVLPEENRGWGLRKIIAAGGFGLAGLLVIVWLIWPRFPTGGSQKLTIYLLDVGQGESIFVEFPNQQTLVIDGGGYYRNSLDVGKLVVAPFIWNRGWRRIDFMAATHSDQDHISGLESLAELFPVGHYLDRDPPATDSRTVQLHTRLRREGAVAQTVSKSKPLQVGEVLLRPLHPDPAFIARSSSQNRPTTDNDLSWVFKIEYGEFSLLLTADISQKVERHLIDQGTPLRARILKAPHHGSRFSNSASFIAAVRPEHVLFSSGHLNPFHHPHSQTVQRYKNAGVQMWQTNREGALRITTDGVDYEIASYNGHEWSAQ